jgi:cytochrome c oxidase assembly protein subunit 11
MSDVPHEMLPTLVGITSHGRGGKTWTDEEAAEKVASLRPRKDGRLITVRFDSTVGDVLPWTFVPAQLDVKVVPGETALSFFTATNKSDKAITGVATYNDYPPKIGLYLNKIQCLCFEEQRLLLGETVDMPVFFFIDPEIMDNPQLSHVNNVTLSYTFFQTDINYDNEEEEEGLSLEEYKKRIAVGDGNADNCDEIKAAWWIMIIPRVFCGAMQIQYVLSLFCYELSCCICTAIIAVYLWLNQ